MTTCPILFLVFNRPEITSVTFLRIREARPTQLFVAADGPRDHVTGEASLCEETRNLITSQIDWNCELHLLFREENLGCRQSVSSAITWFFEHVEYGIILEDDCLPELTFFNFCTEMLSRYKDEESVVAIGGTNVFGTWERTPYSYLYSYQGSIWGWASWRRAWALYDINLSDWETTEIRKDVRKVSLTDHFYKKREQIFNSSKKEQIDTWDYQWLYTRLKHKGLTIIPATNQVSNLGFNEFATHTKKPTSKFSALTTYPMHFPLNHPEDIRLDEQFELAFLGHIHGNREERANSYFQSRLKRIRDLF